MTGNTFRLTCSIILLSLSTALSSISVPPDEVMISQSEYVIIGKLTIEDGGKAYITAEESLKGNVAKGAKFLVTVESGLGYFFVPGGFDPPLESNLNTQLKKENWYGKKIIFLGNERGGRWISTIYHYAVWGKRLDGYREKHVMERRDQVRKLIQAAQANAKNTEKGSKEEIPPGKDATRPANPPAKDTP